MAVYRVARSVWRHCRRAKPMGGEMRLLPKIAPLLLSSVALSAASTVAHGAYADTQRFRSEVDCRQTARVPPKQCVEWFEVARVSLMAHASFASRQACEVRFADCRLQVRSAPGAPNRAERAFWFTPDLLGIRVRSAVNGRTEVSPIVETTVVTLRTGRFSQAPVPRLRTRSEVWPAAGSVDARLS